VVASNDGHYGFRRVTAIINDSSMAAGKGPVQFGEKVPGFVARAAKPTRDSIFLASIRNVVVENEHAA
jgi:hypothetical protein